MAFVQNNVFKCNMMYPVLRQNIGLLFGTFNKTNNLALSTQSGTTKTNTNNKEITKSVFISQSRDVFTNLALEDWLYKNFDFTNHHVMLLWRNNPCVVIGRHQNPWSEADVDNLNGNGVELARRNSGGGSVYHDEGNLNITFFVPRERYNRKQNLELLARTLEKEWSLHPEINKKEDIILDSVYKISGTASKLGRPNTYHHCTLLVDVDKEKLSKSLQKDKQLNITTTATKSVPAPTVNLSDLNSGINIDKLLAAVGWSYLRTSAVTQKDEGWDHVQKQRGFQMINPTEDWFPGIEGIRKEFNSWEWKFGKTPKFTISKNYELTGTNEPMKVDILVDKGIVEEVSLHLPDGISWAGLSGTIPLFSSVAGQRFVPALFSQVEQAIKLQPIQFIEESFKNIEMAARA